MYQFGIICAFSLVTFVVVSADKSSILINDDRVTWISSGLFARIIETSLNLSACTNVYLSDNSVGNQNVFTEFVRVYPYEYTINDRTYWCNGYLGISMSCEKMVHSLKRVPTKISTIELLIVVNEEVDESAELFNVSMYENANVNIVTPNGFWSLSESYLDPRKFKRFLRSEDLVHKRGIVNLQGRTLQAAAFYYPPLSYLNTTVNRTVNGIEGEFFIKKFELDGIETKLFLLLADRLNFTWMIRKPNNQFRYGRRNGSTWYGGMIGQMFRKEIDIAFTGIWLELDHYLFTNLSKPWTNFDINFLVPRPKPSPSFWALTRPLSPAVWSAVIAMVIVQSIYVYTKAWINPRVPARFRSFVTTWTELTARLVGTCPSRNIQGLKFQFQLWHLIGVLIVTAYSSSLAARLASSGYEARIDTTRQFIEANLSWGREGPIPKFNNYFGELDPWAMQFKSRFKHEKNEAERHAKIMSGNYAIVGRMVGGIFFPENTIRDEDMKNYRLMRNSVGNFYSSFAVQPWLLNAVDQVMLRLREAGLVVYHLRDVLHRRTTNANREVLVEHDGNDAGARVLELTPLGAGFSMLAVGLTLATIVFYFELKFVSGQESIIKMSQHREHSGELVPKWNERIQIAAAFYREHITMTRYQLVTQYS